MPIWNGIQFISPSHNRINVYMDVSGSKGLGSHFGLEWFAARCPCCLRCKHIQVKDIFTVVYAVMCWGNQFKGSHIVFHVDNEAVFNALHNLSIRSAATMKFVGHLVALTCHLDFSFSSEWLSSSKNCIADAASHFSFSCMFSSAPWLNKKASSKLL